MDKDSLKKANLETLKKEIDWLISVIDTRLKLYFENESEFASIFDIAPPDISDDSSSYSFLVKNYEMTFAERVILILALIPHVKPQILDVFFTKNASYDRGYSEFGGIVGMQHAGFLPTGETAAFILAENNLESRFSVLEIFHAQHFFRKNNILKLDSTQSNEPFLSGLLNLSVEYQNYLTIGAVNKPDYNFNFPAKLIETALNWTELVLEDQTLNDVLEIRAWIEHGATILNDLGLKKRIKPGYRSLFYGPPGTGKTFTASLLGKSTGLDVYRIDLSIVVSKYIGETEKNLTNIFEQAENRNWLLFFDEADAIFGKRTQTCSSNNRYSNQLISYLLQKIEDFPGVVILATNLKANLDEAFIRRFQSTIYFPMPNSIMRLKLWQNVFSDKLVLSEEVQLEEIAEKYELSGGAIINVLRYCSLMAVKKGSNVILQNEIMDGIHREFKKEGKIVS